jgi:anti-sigma B factor antagonist
MSGTRRDCLEVEEIGDVTVVNFKVKSILDQRTIQLIGKELDRLVDTHVTPKMLLNFGNVEFLSTAALGILIALHKRVRSAGRRLLLGNLDSEIREVFEITRLNTFFEIVPAPDEGDTDGNMGGVTARLKPPKPSSGGAVSLQPPGPEGDD